MFYFQGPIDQMSTSSAGSKRNRNLERSSSEFYEAAPHLSDALTSPDHSPPISPASRRKFHDELEMYDDTPYDESRHRIIVRSSHHEQQYRSEGRHDYRSDRSTHSGREEMYSLAETEVSGWARK